MELYEAVSFPVAGVNYMSVVFLPVIGSSASSRRCWAGAVRSVITCAALLLGAVKH